MVLFVEAQDTTVVGAWETLVFDFGNPTNQTLNLQIPMTRCRCSNNFNVSGANDTFYWDDVEFVITTASVQMDLVTFDDASVSYGVIAFEGAVSSIIVDPNDASNMLVQSEKPVGAQPWAGTSWLRTQQESDRLLSAIPFTAIDQRLSVRMGTTDKVFYNAEIEDETNNTISVEAQDVIDVANAWDLYTLTTAVQVLEC